MINKAEIRLCLQRQKERERIKREHLKWYFWNLKQYRNGGVICPKCGLIIAKDKSVEFNYLTNKYIYTCVRCYYEFSIGKFGTGNNSKKGL